MSTDVSIAYCGDRSSGPIKGGHVIADIFFVVWLKPCVFIILIIYKGGNHYPKTGENVRHHQKCKDKETEPFESKTQLKEVTDVFEKLALLLDNLQNPNQSRELNKFVQFSNPCYSDHRTHICLALDNDVKWNNCK